MRIQAEAGPSLREIELEKINKQLLAENLCIKPISSDGHCLYRLVICVGVFYNILECYH